MTRRPWRRWVAALLAAPLVVAAYGFWEATRAPLVRYYDVQVATWPHDMPPVRIALLTDIHVAGPDMPVMRLRAIVDQVNRLDPDIITLTGDFISDKTLRTSTVATADAIRPLAALHARHGVFAVLGNHDWWRDGPGLITALRQAGITVLENSRAKAGRLIVAGVADINTRRPNISTALTGTPTGAPIILLSHSPDIFPAVPPSVAVTLAGHTHGGQIILPVIGPILTASRYGKRYVYGHVIEADRQLIVSSGLGTSILPIRIGVPPEIVVVTVGPSRGEGRYASTGRKSGTDR